MALLLNNLGTYTTIEQVWADHPEGGREGDYVVIGSSTYYWDKYSRCWVQSSAVPGQSGGGSQLIDGDLTVTGDLGVGGDAVINGRLIVNGQEVVPGAGGGGGDTGTAQLAFKSIVFKRSDGRPNAPTDGAFGNPVPNGWYDSVPQGTAPIWMSSRYFTSDNQRPAGVNNDNWNVWSTPALMSDTEDFDVEFSPAATTSVPTAPIDGVNTHGGSGDQLWFDPVLDPTANWSQMNWMATRSKYVNDSGNETWTQWKIILIKGEPGEAGNPGANGDGFRCVYAKTTGLRPTITSQGYPPTGSTTWYKSVSQISLSVGDVLWMAEKRCNDGVWGNWGTPVRISGTNGSDGQPGTPGTPGADGADIEFIYKQSNSLPGVSDTAPTSVDEDDDVPEGWSDNPSGVDLSHKYEWMCQRTKPAGHNQSWGPWIGPFVWSAYGEQGMDGDGIEYIYRNDLTNVNAVIANPSYQYTKPDPNNPLLTQNVLRDNYTGGVFLRDGGNPNVSNDWRPDGWDDSMGTNFSWVGGTYNGYGEWIPSGWHDDPVGVNSTNKEEYVSTRKRHKGVWSNWCAPTLWAKYSEEHIMTIDSEGYWCIDGVRYLRDGQPVRAEGQNGTGVAIKDSVDYLTTAQATANVEGITNPTSLQGLSVSGLTVGDCYIVDFVTYENSQWTKKGYVYAYNGGTSSDYTDNWKELGQFRGEPGQSQYMHIAWATAVDTSGSTPALPSGASWCWAYENRNSALSYDWMGIRVDNDPNDSQTFTDYEWHYIKGVDGAFQEFVYIRTTGETNPGVKNSYASGYKDSNNHAPDASEFLPQTTETTAREYTDDPKGVGEDPTTHVFYKCEWMSKRTKGSDGTWSNWSTPALWAVYGEDGQGIESVQDYYMLSMKSKGVTLQNTQDSDWGTDYLEPTAELPYLWHYTYYEYSDGSEYASPCHVLATYSARSGDNLLLDADFLSLDAMAAWIHKGDLGGSADPVTNGHTVSVVAGKDGHNAFSVAYQGNDEEGYIEYLCQNIYSDAAKRIKPDTWYTLSFWQKGTVNDNSGALETSKPFRLDLSGLSDIIDTTTGVKMYKNGTESQSGTTVNFAPNNDGSWTYHTFTFKTKSALTGTLKFRLLMYTRLTIDTMQVCMPKLEEGRMATPYSPAEEHNSPAIRTSTWAAGVAYMQGALGEPFIDIVNFGGTWYRCLRSHTSASQLTPSNTNYWEAASGFKFIATDIFFADKAKINNLVADYIQTDAKGSPRVEMHGSVAQFFGTLSTPSIEMMVDADGSAYLRFYDKDGNELYDLGPRGISWLRSETILAYFSKTDSQYVKMSGSEPDMSNSTTGQAFLYQFNAQRTNGTIQGDNTYTGGSAATAAAADGKYYASNAAIASNTLANGLYRPTSYNNKRTFTTEEKAGDVEALQAEMLEYGLTQAQIENFDWEQDQSLPIPAIPTIYMQDYVWFNNGVMRWATAFSQAEGTVNEVIEISGGASNE